MEKGIWWISGCGIRELYIFGDDGQVSKASLPTIIFKLLQTILIPLLTLVKRIYI